MMCWRDSVKSPITLLAKLTDSYWGGWVWSAHSGTDLLRLSHAICFIWVKPWVQSGGIVQIIERDIKKSNELCSQQRIYRICEGQFCMGKFYTSKNLVQIHMRKSSWSCFELLQKLKLAASYKNNFSHFITLNHRGNPELWLVDY